MQESPDKQQPDYNGGPPVAAPIRLTAPMEAAGMRLDQGLAQWLPQYSRTRLQGWIESGCVTLDNAPTSVRHKLRGGEIIMVLPQAAADAAAFEPQEIALSIVHEDDAVIVIDKPPGLVAHPAAGNWDGTLLNALLHHAPALRDVPRAGIVHRLDKDTSGLLVVAKTLQAQTALVRQLQARTVKREYVALASGRLEGVGSVEGAIGRHPSQRTRMAVLDEDAAGAKPAVTHFKVLRHYVREGMAATLIECRLETGRTHQIRVHLQHLGHALVGDQTYGRQPWRGWFHRQALHARRLAIDHPTTGQRMEWEAPLAGDMQALLDNLEAG